METGKEMSQNFVVSDKSNSLGLLRDQLRHMRSSSVRPADGPLSVSPRRGVLTLEAVAPAARAEPPGIRGKLRGLEARLRRHLDSAPRRRGGVACAIGELRGDAERARREWEASVLETHAQLQQLRQRVSIAARTVEDIPRVAAAVIKDMRVYAGEGSDLFAHNDGDELHIVFRLNEVQKKVNTLQLELEKKYACKNLPSVVAAERLCVELRKEREEADARFLTLKESFVSMVKYTLDELEKLRAERVEVEAQCVEILS